MSKVLTVTDKSFSDTIKDGLVVIDFWADWCGPCKMLSPVLDELSYEYDKVTIGKVNVDENSIIPADFSIRSIPTLIFFKDGEKIETVTGALPKQKIIEIIEKNL